MSPTAKLLIALSQCMLLASQASAASLTISRPEEAGLSAERLKRIRSVVQGHIDAKDFAGAVTLVARKGKVVHFEAQGTPDLESGKPMRTDTLFRMASMTKPITAVAVLMLMEEGKLVLSDPVSKFIP
jgi:CubicO group peptidase (beta-lactamase class C family)